MSYEVTLLVFGILLLLLGLIGKIKAKEIEVGTSNTIVRVITLIIGVILIVLSFNPEIPKNFLSNLATQGSERQEIEPAQLQQESPEVPLPLTVSEPNTPQAAYSAGKGSDLLIADTPKKLLQKIFMAVQQKKYDEIRQYVYPLNLVGMKKRGKTFHSNYQWFIYGIKNPSTSEFIHTSYNNNAMELLISHANSFQAINDKVSASLLKKFTDGFFVDMDQNQRLTEILEKNERGIVSLCDGERSSCIFMVKTGNEYKLFWWKHLVRVANSFK